MDDGRSMADCRAAAVVFPAASTDAGEPRLALEYRIEAQLPRVQAPTLVVRGARDLIVPAYWAREAAALLPRGRYAEVPGGPHCINYTAPDRFVRLVGAFLSDCGAS